MHEEILLTVMLTIGFDGVIITLTKPSSDIGDVKKLVVIARGTDYKMYSKKKDEYRMYLHNLNCH